MMFAARTRIKALALGSGGDSPNGVKPLFYDDTFSENCVQQASYDLRLGSHAYLVGEDAPVFLSESRPYLRIPPGQFAVLTCFEKLDMPRDMLGLITLKNGLKTQGLVNVSGFHVDPTYKGILIFAVNNAGPSDIRLRFMDPTFTIFFAALDGDILEARPEQKRPVLDIPAHLVQYLGGSSVTLAKLQKDIEDLRTKVLIYGPLAVAALVALLLNLLKSR